MLNELIINGKGKYRLLDESPYISKIGIAFQKGTHEELTQKINGLIKEMSEDGTIGSIAEKYGLDADGIYKQIKEFAKNAREYPESF